MLAFSLKYSRIVIDIRMKKYVNNETNTRLSSFEETQPASKARNNRSDTAPNEGFSIVGNWTSLQNTTTTHYVLLDKKKICICI